MKKIILLFLITTLSSNCKKNTESASITAPNQPIGTDWVQYNPSFTTQVTGLGLIPQGDTGLTFILGTGVTDPNDIQKDRAERRYQTMSHVKEQFQGEVCIKNLDGDRICINQTFQDKIGPYNLISVKHVAGSRLALYEAEGGNLLTTQTFSVGDWIKINTIVDTTAKSVEVYINDILAETKTNAILPLYKKIGAYRTESGIGPANVTWRNINFWYK